MALHDGGASVLLQHLRVPTQESREQQQWNARLDVRCTCQHLRSIAARSLSLRQSRNGDPNRNGAGAAGWGAVMYSNHASRRLSGEARSLSRSLLFRTGLLYVLTGGIAARSLKLSYFFHACLRRITVWLAASSSIACSDCIPPACIVGWAADECLTQ